MKNQELIEKLKVGAKIKIGRKYADEYGFEEGQVVELVEGVFEYDNGLYVEDRTAPAIWDENRKEFDSIYHLFGNNLEDFLDCKVIS